MTTIAKICIMHGIWHDLFVGNYTVDKLKIGYNIQIVLCIEQSVSADFPLLLILIDLFFVYFWANRRWVFWTVVQCQDQNQNREHKQTNRHYHHLYHHISHYASRLLTAAIGHNKSMILFQLQKKINSETTIIRWCSTEMWLQIYPTMICGHLTTDLIDRTYTHARERYRRWIWNIPGKWTLARIFHTENGSR